MSDDELEVIHGSGNVYRDVGYPDADIRQAKAVLGAKIIGILEDRKLSTRQAQRLTGVDQSDFVRIKNAQFSRFTIDRLMTIINKLDHAVDLQVDVRPLGKAKKRKEPVPA